MVVYAVGGGLQVLGLAQVHARIISRQYRDLSSFVYDIYDLLAAAAFNHRLLPSVRYSAQRLYPKLIQRMCASCVPAPRYDPSHAPLDTIAHSEKTASRIMCPVLTPQPHP